MEHSQQAVESLVPVGLELYDIASESIPSDDQYFLLHFIMGTFFGPDLRGERQQKPVLQRLAEGLPSYTYEKLSGSHIRTIELERIYYYILRKADPSVVVQLPWLHQFLHGTLPIQTKSSTAAYPQFPDLFSPRFHPHSWFQDGNKIIENIVFINYPDVYYMKSRDIKRFKRLTGLQDLNLDRDAARLHTSVDGEILYSVAVQEVDSNGGFPRSPPSPSGENNSKKTRLLSDFTQAENGSQNGHVSEPVSNLPYNGLPTAYNYVASTPGEVGSNDAENLGQGMVFLPSQPTLEDWENIVTALRGGSALTGTATKGRFGPAIGLVDIGECEDSYLFRVSLPGVKRDEREFNCEVENDGKVVIKGVTTAGERSVCRYSQVFEMKTQNLSPPGHFSISFKLPGPVDPEQFTGNFGTDGILEGIVMKDIKMALTG